jgi:lysophospholipase L1-like esterase
MSFVHAFLRRFAAAAGLLLGLLGCGGGAETPAATAPERWTVLGSSTAAGVGASPGQGWAALLTARVAPNAVAVDNASRSGAVTYLALPAATPRPAGRPATDAALDIDTLLANRPRLVILAFPTNDAMAGYAASETIANLTLLRARAQAQGAAVLVLSSQPRNDASPGQREVMRAVDQALGQAVGPCFVDVSGGLADADGRIAAAYSAGDGVHLNDAGHRWMFERVFAALTAGSCVRLGTG